jgi:hypothetical protein
LKGYDVFGRNNGQCDSTPSRPIYSRFQC